MEDTIFDYIKDVLFQKKGIYKSACEEQLNIYPFMLQRWCSMADNDATLIMNETSNKWLTTLTNKKHCYQLLLTILPKIKQKRVAYIKKANKSDSIDEIKNISSAAELSTREVEESLIFLKSLNL